MTEPTPLQMLGRDTRPMFDRFWGIIAPYQRDLWNYCRKIAGNTWDGEDLYQDTIMKMFTSLSSISIQSQVLHPKSYFFRVATNHWIDSCRKRQKHTAEEYVEEYGEESSDARPEAFEVYESIEHLLGYLPPKQVVAIVLVEAFDFTANEAADIMGTTEGAVNALVFRGRRNLRKMRRSESEHIEKKHVPACDAVIVQKYVEYFNARDFHGLAGLLAEHSVFSFVTQASKEYGRDTIINASHNPAHYENEDIQAVVTMLWDRTVVIFYRVGEDAKPLALNEVLTIETEYEHIVEIKGYYYCPEFMEAAADELGVPRDS
ncbi:RNA polymerase sigma factor [Cohnella mopanensis]|uniref:RNA polymerase sigma factor n=1 Tax=Cohnella mopanensis TaxID=2911966 RepID=UPI001EF76691|nr:RNA polymerase sigma factor [Cohnella mopanensis]